MLLSQMVEMLSLDSLNTTCIVHTEKKLKKRGLILKITAYPLAIFNIAPIRGIYPFARYILTYTRIACFASAVMRMQTAAYKTIV